MIALFARHPTAANLLMAAMLVIGLLALSRMNKQFFPDFGIDSVIVTVAWPGAGAEDVDNAVVQAIEPEVRFLDRVKRVISSSRTGSASVRVDFEAGTDMQAALADVEAAVSRVATLPEDSEAPWIRRVVRFENLLRIVVSGDLPERTLKTWALRMRDGLIRAGVDEVETVGARDEWILVEADQRDLLALDLPVSEISRRIAGASRDIPGGDTGGRSVSRVRSLGLARTAEEVAAIEIRAFPDGRRLTVGEIADVSEAWNEDQPRIHFHGRPAVELVVKRATTADALATAEAASRFLEDFLPTLPPGITVKRYDEAAELIDQRIDLLIRNGLGGMVIVLVVLFVFLNARTALWVAAGIPAALLAAMALAWAFGHAINMIILFGAILAIGLVVDDAIVVAEHAETRARRGDDQLQAAVEGARRMAGPVFSSSLTTIAAFLPLILIGGIIGQIIREIPIIVVLALVASLVECFLVLPGHLRHSLAATAAAAEGRASRFRRGFDEGFRRFREGPFRRLVGRALVHRYLVLSLAVGLLIVSIGVVSSGRIGFTFFPSVEPNSIFANLRMFPGTTRADTRERLFQIERGARAAAEAFGAPGLVQASLVVEGAERAQSPAGPRQGGDTVGAVVVELVDSDKRDVRTKAFVQSWRDSIGPVAGADTLTIRAATAGPPGREIDVRFSGDSLDDLKAAAGRVKALLASYPGVSAIEDDLAYGNREMQLRVTPAGRALGFDIGRAGNQIRSALQGDIALRFARGDEEVEVRVRQKENPGGLGTLYLIGPDGTEVPLSAVATVTPASSYDVIRRERGRREVAVTAEVDESVTASNVVLAALRRDGIAKVAGDAGLEWRFAGKAEEQEETFSDMGVGAAIGLAGMFLVLAWIFGSYSRPVAVLAVVPLGFIGVCLGHFFTGFDLTILSMIGMIGLSGIVINDSIVLIVAITDHEQEGKPVHQAIEDGTCDRLRAVILTSLTTISGLLPLCFETSLQAQFLIPVALTIVAGLATATFLVLFVVPAMLAVGHDLRRLAGGAPARGATGDGSPPGRRNRTGGNDPMTPPRIALLGIMLESNAFAPPTTEADFRRHYYREGEALLTDARAEISAMPAEMAAFVQAMDATGPWKPAPLLFASSPPWGPADWSFIAGCLERIETMLAEAGPVDGVFIANHGAMTTTETLDPDGEIVARLRALAGAGVPVIVTHDLHANLSERLVEAADIVIGYTTNPHVDMRQRGDEAAFAMRRMLAGMRPKSAFIRLPLTPPSVTLLTAEGPYADMIDHGQRRLRESGGEIVNVTILGGFVFSDTPKNGLAIVVTAREDEASARSLAREIAEYGWSMRQRFRRELVSVEAAVARALETAADPARPAIILSDAGDNPGGGGEGRTTWLLRALVEVKAKRVYYGSFFDPQLALEAHRLGEGAEFEAVFNREGDTEFSKGLRAPARILKLTDGRFVGRLGIYRGRQVELGPSAALRIGGPDGITVIVIGARHQTADPMFFESFGLDIAAARAVCVKSRGHFRAGFMPWFPPSQVLEVDTAGLTSPVLDRFRWQRLPRPVHPLDEAAEWTPPAW